ncbi:CAP domain-containing protein [Microscilla marina]|uniref:Transporter n=1 Tax=Microscilla marina ATCC 23134 TaxID=313606 RepID=A1ZWQ6_MICM2|nr:CAP domain-containing protein [Microscilla marina]EAY25188.1 transporter [Microscilla marina ATCC 23134]
MLKLNYTTLLIFCIVFMTASCVKQDVEPDNTTTNSGNNGGTDDNDNSGGGDDDNNNGNSGGSSGSTSFNLDKDKILALVNEARTKGTTCGSNAKPPVTAIKWNDELAKAALDHSNDMQAQDYFSHTGKNGSKFSERAKDAGYTGFPTGENIAWGYSSEEAVIKGWLESTGHCNNIMNGNSNEIGIARSATGNYWTMVLGKSK